MLSPMAAVSFQIKGVNGGFTEVNGLLSLWKGPFADGIRKGRRHRRLLSEAAPPRWVLSLPAYATWSTRKAF